MDSSVVAYPSAFGQELSKRGTRRKSTVAVEKSGCDKAPRIARSFGNGTGVPAWPVARACFPGVGPCQDLRNRERRKAHAVANTPPFGQKLGQRGTAPQSAIAPA